MPITRALMSARAGSCRGLGLKQGFGALLDYAAKPGLQLGRSGQLRASTADPITVAACADVFF